MGDGFDVVVGAGTLRSDDPRAVRFAHRWTPEGVTVDADFTGGHLLHLAAAGCVQRRVPGGRPTRDRRPRGARRRDGWVRHRHMGVHWYHLLGQLSSSAPAEAEAHLMDIVDAVAEIPRAIRSGAPVLRDA